jgi:hypothetical protein
MQRPQRRPSEYFYCLEAEAKGFDTSHKDHNIGLLLLIKKQLFIADPEKGSTGTGNQIGRSGTSAQRT